MTLLQHRQIVRWEIGEGRGLSREDVAGFHLLLGEIREAPFTTGFPCPLTL